MKINLVNNISFNKKNTTKSNPLTQNLNNTTLNNVLPQVYPSVYYLSFQGRIDKGLKSFVERNSEYLPETFKKYTEELSEEEKKTMTPLQAMYGAYEYLDICDTAEDIKDIYPDEPLFQNLMSLDKLNSKRGLLFDIKLMKDDVEASGQSVLLSGEDLTVYLVKKIFLEGKTINKINEDLDKDINPIFQREDKNYILTSTLKALGIKLPKVEFINSLKYTQEGYSDAIADKMRARWQNLSEEEKESYKHSIITAKQQNEEKLSEEEKLKNKQLRSNAQKQRWAQMTPEEKAEQINSLLVGSRKYRVVMVNAWNKTPEIREALSRKLTAVHISNPIEKLYKPGHQSSIMSKTMTEFWKEQPEYASIIGDAIALSFDEYDQAKESGKEEEFIEKVFNEQAKNISEFNQKKGDEICANIAMASFLIDQEFEYIPRDVCMELGQIVAKHVWGGKHVSVVNKLADNKQLFISQLTEFLRCAKDEKTKKFLYNCMQSSVHISDLGKKIKENGLTFDYTIKNGKTYKVEFSEVPIKENIEKSYEAYNKKLTIQEQKKIINALKEICEDYGIPKSVLVKNSIWDRVIQKYGAASLEALDKKSELGKFVLNDMMINFCLQEIEKKGQEFAQQGRLDEFYTIFDSVIKFVDSQKEQAVEN